MRKYFRSKKIVYTHQCLPAELVKVFTFGGTRYVRIAFTNRVRFLGTAPTTDVRLSDVDAIKALPSPFKKCLYALAGLRAKPKVYKIKH